MANYFTDMLNFTFWRSPNNLAEVSGTRRSFGSWPGWSDYLRVRHKGDRNDLIHHIETIAKGNSDVSNYLERIKKEDDQKSSYEDNLDVNDASKVKATAATIIKRAEAIQNILRNTGQPEDRALAEKIAKLKKTTAGWGLLQLAIIEPFNRFFRVPNPNTGEPTGKINFLAFLWPPKWIDFIFEAWNGMCDFIGSRAGKTGTHVNKPIDHDWRSRLAQIASFILRLPCMIVQNVFNLLLHPIDSLFGPFYNAYSLWKNDKISGGRALWIGFLQLLKLALIAIAIATIVGAPALAPITAAFDAIPGMSAISTATNAVVGSGFGVAPVLSAAGATTAAASVTTVMAPLATIAAAATSPTGIGASVVMEVTGLRSKTDVSLEPGGLQYYRPSNNFGKIWGTSVEEVRSQTVHDEKAHRPEVHPAFRATRTDDKSSSHGHQVSASSSASTAPLLSHPHSESVSVSHEVQQEQKEKSEKDEEQSVTHGPT